jgi:3-oxoacyl-[acyl-carrier protein] reductase
LTDWTVEEETKMLLEGKRVVVTGASRGLGRAVAQACAAQGADLVINGRDVATLSQTAELVRATGRACEVVPGSVADFAVCEAIIDRAGAAFGGLDALVNNAGITRDRTLMKMSPEEFREVIDVNLFGTFACGKLAAQAMRETGGAIVNVVSNTAFSGAVGQSNYGASKAGVAGLTRTWTRELGRYGIRVNAIWPIAQTDMTSGLIERMAADGQTAMELGFGPPEEVAKIVVYLASKASAALSGQVVTFNGRRLALWNHPSEVELTERDGWTLETIAAEFDGPLADRLQPLYDAF